MKIYGGSASPFVQRLLMGARLKGHELAVEPPPGGAQSPEFRAISPLGRIPVLDHDGWALPESGAILGYLDDMLDGPSLYPDDARTTARIRVIEAIGTAELGAFRPIIGGAMFGRPVDPAVLTAARAQVTAGLAAIEQLRGNGDEFAIGATPTAADCLLTPILTLIEIADPSAGSLALLEPNAGLVDYKARMESHEIVGRSAREMREGFAKMFAR